MTTIDPTQAMAELIRVVDQRAAIRGNLPTDDHLYVRLSAAGFTAVEIMRGFASAKQEARK